MGSSSPFQPYKWLIQSERAATTVIFALILPFYIAFYALAIDGSLLMNKRARLADGLNEAVLTIAAVNNRNLTAADRKENYDFLQRYLAFYMPNAEYERSNANIHVEDNSKSTDPSQRFIDYYVNANVQINTILSNKSVGLNSFNADLLLLSDGTNSGKARKFIRSQPVDFVFVLDFSRSMQEELSADGSTTRIDMLKRVVSQVVPLGLSSPETTFGIVPFDIGVPVRLPGQRNEAGGEAVGCSTLFVPKDNRKINYGFWANKFIDAKDPSLSSTSDPWIEKEIYWRMDTARYQYYLNTVLPAIDPGKDMATLVTSGLCSLNANDGRVSGRALYSCAQNTGDSIFTNQGLISAEYAVAIRNIRDMRSANETQNGLGLDSIANINSIDVSKTLSGMFNENNVVTFVQPWATNTLENRAFGTMCQSGTQTTWNKTPTVDRIKEPDAYYPNQIVTEEQSQHGVISTIKTAKAGAYLIELTRDQTKLNEFQTMIPNGGTDSTSGLLRAVPVLAKGKNTRKAIIIISDGEDSPGPKQVTDLFHSNRAKGERLCDKIKEGFMAMPNAESFNIYFISVSAASTSDPQVSYWQKYCVDDGNAMVASDPSALLDSFNSIISTETGFFFNTNSK